MEALRFQLFNRIRVVWIRNSSSVDVAHSGVAAECFWLCCSYVLPAGVQLISSFLEKKWVLSCINKTDIERTNSRSFLLTKLFDVVKIISVDFWKILTTIMVSKMNMIITTEKQPTDHVRRSFSLHFSENVKA